MILVYVRVCQLPLKPGQSKLEFSLFNSSFNIPIGDLYPRALCGRYIYSIPTFIRACAKASLPVFSYFISVFRSLCPVNFITVVGGTPLWTYPINVDAQLSYIFFLLTFIKIILIFDVSIVTRYYDKVV